MLSSGAKHTAAKDHKITCEYRATGEPGYIYPGYIYKVNGTVQNSGYKTNDKTIVGNDIYGAAYTNNHSDNSTYPFSNCDWWLASPSYDDPTNVCNVIAYSSSLNYNDTDSYFNMFSLLASVSL